jgi:predicted nucleic acid-binding protein
VLEAREEIERLKTFFSVLFDTESIYDQWERLVTTYQVKGINVHDARLVAAMRVHEVSHILTFNIEDFNRYAGEITPTHPCSVTT